MPRRSDSARGVSGAYRSSVGAGIVILRIFLGVKLFMAGLQKWDWIGTPQLKTTIQHWTSAMAEGSYYNFLTHSVLPHYTLFTYLVVFGELGVGLMLIMGLLTRVSALLAIVMNLNYLLAGWLDGPTTQGLNECFLAIEFALLIAGAGRVFGLDAILARNRPGWILW